MIIAFLLNLIIIVFEIYTLFNLKRKIEIFKYYTYLQNFLCLFVSVVFCIYVVVSMFFDVLIPEYVRGLRFIVSTGLVFTSFIYIMLLSSNKKNMITDKDFRNISGKKANIVLHYLCPVISLISFIVFEKNIILNEGIWTMLVAIPSCLYWVVYLILTITKLWDEPYDFSAKSNKLWDILLIVLIPISFIIISFIIWNIR